MSTRDFIQKPQSFKLKYTVFPDNEGKSHPKSTDK